MPVAGWMSPEPEPGDYRALREMSGYVTNTWGIAGMRRGLVAAAFVAGVVLLAFAPSRRAPHITLLAPAQRRAVPAFSLPLLSGGVWRSEEHRGQVILVNRWATWCLPCRRELPVLSALATEEGSSGLAVVGVRADEGDRRTKAAAFLRSSPVAYPIAVPEQLPPIGAEDAMVPTTVLIDRQGRVAAVLAGAFEERALRDAVEQLLHER